MLKYIIYLLLSYMILLDGVSSESDNYNVDNLKEVRTALKEANEVIDDLISLLEENLASTTTIPITDTTMNPTSESSTETTLSSTSESSTETTMIPTSESSTETTLSSTSEFSTITSTEGTTSNGPAGPKKQKLRLLQPQKQNYDQRWSLNVEIVLYNINKVTISINEDPDNVNNADDLNAQTANLTLLVEEGNTNPDVVPTNTLLLGLMNVHAHHTSVVVKYTTDYVENLIDEYEDNSKLLIILLPVLFVCIVLVLALVFLKPWAKVTSKSKKRASLNLQENLDSASEDGISNASFKQYDEFVNEKVLDKSSQAVSDSSSWKRPETFSLPVRQGSGIPRVQPQRFHDQQQRHPIKAFDDSMNVSSV